MRVMTPEDTAWFCGLWEGEGSVHVVKKKKWRLQVIVSIGMTDKDVLEHVLETTGCGRIYGPYEPKGSIGKKKRWWWKVTVYEDSVALLKALEPKVFARRKRQVNKALDQVRGFVPKCRNGKHAMTEANIWQDARGCRRCRACSEAAKAKRRKLAEAKV